MGTWRDIRSPRSQVGSECTSLDRPTWTRGEVGLGDAASWILVDVDPVYCFMSTDSLSSAGE